MSLEIINKYKVIRQKLKSDYYEYQLDFDTIISEVDKYITNPNISELEKAFYLLLNRYPGDKKDYIIIPNEKVLIKNVYDIAPPYYEYEIDFAIYGGIVTDPIKIAIECDGIRSHSEKHSDKDRRKSINLQASSWFLIHIKSHELHKEIDKFFSEDLYISDLVTNIENVIESKLNLLDHHKYSLPENRSKITGYTWSSIKCTNCKEYIDIVLNHKTVTCRFCKVKFERDRSNDPILKYEFDGILYFK